MDRRKFDVAFSSLTIFVSLVILTSDTLVEGGVETELGSMFLPRIVAVFIILFSLGMGVPSLRRLIKDAPLGGLDRIDTAGTLGVVIYLAILIAYWAAMPQVGFLVATPVAMFAIGWLLLGRNWIVMAIVSLVTTVVVYFGSSLVLRIYFPAWSLN